MEIKEIEFESECYPRQLKNIQNPPQKLYVLGDEKILNNVYFNRWFALLY